MNMYIQHRKIIGYDSEEKQWHVYYDESMVPKDLERFQVGQGKKQGLSQ